MRIISALSSAIILLIQPRKMKIIIITMLKLLEYDDVLDVAPITFEIQDFTQPIWYLGWVNVPLTSSRVVATRYHDAEMIWLKQDTLCSIDSIKQAIDDGSANYALRQATLDSSAHYNTCYSGADQVLSLFLPDNFSVKKEQDRNIYS